MPKPGQLLLLALFVSLLSCKNEQHATFAIRDFRPALRPYLIKIVARGIVMGYDSSLRNMATDNELMQLGQSEHPVLRASAYREMLQRKSFNHYNTLMNHLDDTAWVETDGGEFGIWTRMVSDDILQEAAWKTKEERDKTIEEVLARHNYLQSAYLILRTIDAQEKYYPYIKDMATRPRRLSDDGYEMNFHDKEFALFGLATFKKKDDIAIIKKQLMEHVGRLSNMSFRLMTEYPDTAYLEVLQSYHRRRFYRFSGDDKEGFTGNDDNRASSADFIDALASQKNEQAARIFDTILVRLPSVTCNRNIKMIEDNVVMKLWDNPNPAYEKLRNKIRGKATAIMKNQFSMPVEPIDIPVDTTKENFHWFTAAAQVRPNSRKHSI